MPLALWARFALAGLAMTAAYLWLPPHGQSAVFVVLGLGATAAIAEGVRRHRPTAPAPWWLLAAGVLCWSLGELAFALYEVQLGDAMPFPSGADALYLAGYPLMVAAVLLVVRRSGVPDTAAWLDACIWALGVVVLAWEPLLEPSLAGEATVAARAVALAYPLGSLLVLLLLLRLVAMRARRPTVYTALAAALACYLVSDVLYGIGELAGTYAVGGLLDLGWLLAYGAIGAIALHPRMVDLTAPPAVAPGGSGRVRLLALACAALLPPALLAYQSLVGELVDGLFLAATSTAVFVLVTLRGLGPLGELEAVTGELRGREAELRRQATTDSLTGLANRTVLGERLTADLAAGGAFCVALLDLDEFKHVNDSRGHEAGDALLVQVGERLRAALREDDLVARLGGDEFAVVSAAPADELLARLTACLVSPVALADAEVAAAASIGIATTADCQGSASDLLRNADLAMYSAKAAGRGRGVLYTPAMSADLLDRLDVRRQLVAAVERQHFVPWLQPVVDLASSRLVGFEALVRWQPPGLSPVPPAAWLPAAEETGLVVEVDRQVLRAAARQLVAWSATVPGAARLELAVNASGRSLAEPDVAEQVLQVLAEEGLDPRRLVLEVTENVLIEEAVGARLQRLREAGVRIALDDFGTGWSSLGYLRRFPVDVLKLDRSFVSAVTEGPAGRAVPAAVLQLAGALGLDVVAEGIETPEQAAALRALGCRTAQGYLLGRPAPAGELLELVRRGRAVADEPLLLRPA